MTKQKMTKQETRKLMDDITSPSERAKLEEAAAHIAYNIAFGIADKKEIVDFVLSIAKKSIESYLEEHAPKIT